MRNLPGRYMACKGVENCQDLDFSNCQFVDIHSFRHQEFHIHSLSVPQLSMSIKNF